MSENLEKRRKYVFQELQSNDMDLLSNLPNSILCQIISKLETIEAVQTSVLSSRYKSLWVNITSLRFTDRDFGYDAVRLAHFVNRVLSFLKSKSINEFCLEVETPSYSYDVPTWFSAAICKNVKMLTLVIHGSKHVDIGLSMPPCLYTSKTLEVLQLYNKASWNVSLDVPEFVSLPNLTTLGLHNVNYSSDESVRRLISGCSSLENLTIERDKLDGVSNYTIHSPTLKTLDYSFMYSFHPQDGSIEEDLEFVLNAPELREFKLFGRRSRVFSVFNLCSLEVAKFFVTSSKMDGIDSHYEKVVQMLQEVHNVSHLWISGDTLEALSHASSLENFSLIAPLTMDTKKSKQIPLDDLPDGSNNIYLSRDSSDTTHVVQWSEPKKLPVCLLSYLKTISVSGFRGRKGELTMIAYILKNANMLKKITISENSEWREKILKFDQGSERCEIIFS